MALHILPRYQLPEEPPSFTEMLGSGLSQGLTQLAQLKIQEMAKNKQRSSAMQALQALGYDPQQAQQLSGLDPQSLKAVVAQRAKAQYQSPSIAPGLQTVMPGLSAQEYQDLAALPPSLLSQYYRDYSQAGGQQGLSEMLGGLALPDQMTPAPIQQRELAVQSDLLPTEQIRPGRERGVPAEEIPVKKSPAARIQEAKLAQAAKKEEARLDKLYRPTVNAQFKSDTVATDNDKRLKRMRELINTGNMPTAAFQNAWKMVADAPVVKDIPIIGKLIQIPFKAVGELLQGLQKYSGGLKSVADIEEFEKLSNDFIRGAKEIFGARVTNYDLENFMKMIPTLSQTDQGKLRIINNMQAFNDAIHVKTKAMKAIIKENNGKIPANFEILAEEIAKPELDLISEKMQLGYGKYDLGEGKTKLPPSEKFPVGSITSKGKQKYINVLTENGQQWQPMF